MMNCIDCEMIIAVLGSIATKMNNGSKYVLILLMIRRQGNVIRDVKSFLATRKQRPLLEQPIPVLG
jgi:hypothetical protein